MKKIFLCIAALLPLMATAQQQPEPFEIKSTVGHLSNPARAYLIYQLGANRVIDSAEITAGSFDFKGNILNPTPAIIVIDPFGKGLDKLDTSADNLNFYIDKGDVVITGKDSIARAQVTGSKINDDNKKLMAQLKPIIAKAQALNAEKSAATPAQLNSAEFQNAMNARQKELQVEQRAVLKIFISTNPDSYLSLLALYSVGGPSPDPSEIDPLYNSLSDRIKNMEVARRLKSSLDALRATAIGTIAPDFTQNDVNGVPIKLSSFRGKYVLVDFWASWCGPCRQENPNVVKAYSKFKDKNFTIIGVSLDKPDGKSAWLAAIQNDNLYWTQVSDLKFWNNEVAALYKVTSIPANFLIGPDGKIIAKNLRGDDLENKLQEVLGN
jgi:peroxiredoxin